MSTRSNPIPDIIPSRGTFNGSCNASDNMVFALTLITGLIVYLEQVASQLIIFLSNLEASIHTEMVMRKQTLWDNYGMQTISDKLARGEKLSLDEQTAVQVYEAELSQVSSITQAAIKELDPSLTTMQNLPQALSSALSQLVQECNAVSRGQIDSARNRIS
jgi:hypothetical protein